ncbi:MAG: DNA gyrase subunit A [Bdellovibrionaceae bacterium]|nr:DNA gyrase subunit A [Pseudobdellovibrionaceae bacterium]
MDEVKDLSVTDIDINKEMKEAYLQYSMSVIVGRALPDVRDGLKPVHRRILFAMYDLNNTYDKPYKKSARVVGDVIGKYHPHGDSAVYDTMVRMAQPFSLREPLIDGQGNFGSIDGDNAAAQRYTEVRMTRLAEEILQDIDKETVDFGPNYDDSLLIPLVLPAKFPALLVNGSSGIAVGMATNIPPHNLGEVIDGCLKYIENNDITLDELINIIPGPDFPTAGIISGRNGILQAYKTGRGVITLKAVTEVEEKKDQQNIIITELPYQVNKAKLIESIAGLVNDKRIEGISDIRDESSREGIRVVIKLKRGENAQVILNQLFKFSQLQVSFGIIMLALDSRNQPKLFNLKEVIEAFIEHRRDVVTRRCIFDLKKAEARAHILEGLKKALDQIDEVIKTIRASKETNIAKENLMNQFGFSDKQSQAILEMRLQRLTGLERDKILNELKEILEKIEWLKKVLSDVHEVYKIISEELREIQEKYANPRRTKIEDDGSDIDVEDLIAKEDIIVSLTNTGYVKRISLDEYRLQKRGGKGLKGSGAAEEDYVSEIYSVNTHTTLMVYSDKGKLYWLKAYKVPKGSRTSKGRSINNIVQLSQGEKVNAILPVEKYEDGSYVVTISEKGVIKKTDLTAFSNPRPSGIIAVKVDLDDKIVSTRLTEGKNDIIIVTKNGMSIRFDEGDARPMGRSARGVKGITLGKNDTVIGAEIIEANDKDTILIITENGYGKRTPLEEYRKQSRGGVGIITQKITDKVGQVVGVKKVKDTDSVLVTTNEGQSIRTPVSDISIFGRNTQGVRIMNLKDGEYVTSVALIRDDEGVEV